MRQYLSCILFSLTSWIAVPKIYFHQLFHHQHAERIIDENDVLQQHVVSECDCENFDKPVGVFSGMTECRYVFPLAIAPEYDYQPGRFRIYRMGSNSLRAPPLIC